MGNVTGTEAQRAFKLRKKLGSKKKISDEDKKWLAAYQKRTGNEKTPAQLLLTAGKSPSETNPLVGDVVIQKVEVGPFVSEPTVSSAGTTDDPGADDEGELIDVPPPLNIPGYEAPPPPREKKATGPSAEQTAQASALANLFVQTVIATNRQLLAEFPDAIVMPEPVVLQFVAPAVNRLAVKYVPVMDVNSDIVDGLAVGVTALMSIGQLHMRRKRKGGSQAARNGVKPTKPFIDVTPEPEKKAPAESSDFTSGFGSPSTPIDGGSPASFGANLKSPWGS